MLPPVEGGDEGGPRRFGGRGHRERLRFAAATRERECGGEEDGRAHGFVVPAGHWFDTTSPPAIEPIARHVAIGIELFTNRTLPSHMATFTPPVCMLRAAVPIRPLGYMHDREFGGPTWK